MTPARHAPTVTLDGERIVCRTAEGAETGLPLRCDVYALEAARAARKLARKVWHVGVRLGPARPVRGGGIVMDVLQTCMGCGVQEAPAGCRCWSCSTPPTAEERAWAARITAGVAS